MEIKGIKPNNTFQIGNRLTVELGDTPWNTKILLDDKPLQYIQKMGITVDVNTGKVLLDLSILNR